MLNLAAATFITVILILCVFTQLAFADDNDRCEW